LPRLPAVRIAIPTISNKCVFFFEGLVTLSPNDFGSWRFKIVLSHSISRAVHRRRHRRRYRRRRQPKRRRWHQRTHRRQRWCSTSQRCHDEFQRCCVNANVGNESSRRIHVRENKIGSSVIVITIAARHQCFRIQCLKHNPVFS